MPESQVMVTLVAVVSVTTGVPGGLGRAVMRTKQEEKRRHYSIIAIHTVTAVSHTFQT